MGNEEIDAILTKSGFFSEVEQAIRWYVGHDDYWLSRQNERWDRYQNALAEFNLTLSKLSPSPKIAEAKNNFARAIPEHLACLLYTSPSPRDQRGSRMPSSA